MYRNFDALTSHRLLRSVKGNQASNERKSNEGNTCECDGELFFVAHFIRVPDREIRDEAKFKNVRYAKSILQETLTLRT